MTSRNIYADDLSPFLMGKALAKGWEADLQALVDGELDEKDRQRVMSAIAGSIELQSRYDYLVSEKELLRLWWAESSRPS